MKKKDVYWLRAEQIILFWLMPALVSLLLLPAFGTTDMRLWLRWAQKLNEFGLISGYQAIGGEYPPGTAVLFYIFLQFLAQGSEITHLLFKVPLLIASWLGAFTVWYWSRNHALALLGGGLCCYFGVGLSYLDGFLFSQLVLAFYFLARQRVLLGLLCYACACYIKYPPLILGPFIFIYLVRTYSLRFTLKVGLPVLAIYLLACLPFGGEVVESFKASLNHKTLSAQAMNFNWILTRYHYETYASWTESTNSLSLLRNNEYPAIYTWLARTLSFSFLAITLLLACKCRRSLEMILACSFMGYFSYFMFTVGVHENHFFYAAVVMIALCCLNPSAWFGTTLLATGICSINAFLFYGVIGDMPNIFLSDTFIIPMPYDLHLLVAALNFAVYGWCWISLLRRIKANSETRVQSLTESSY